MRVVVSSGLTAALKKVVEGIDLGKVESLKRAAK